MSVKKIDLTVFAREVAELGGLRSQQAPGLAWLFRLVEKEAFCAAVRMARGSSFATDPSDLYAVYQGFVVPPITLDGISAPPEAADAVREDVTPIAE